MIIGREKEIEELNRLYNGNKAELVAIYGRRRVGKTFLVDEVFKDKFTFRHAGLSPVDVKNSNQLKMQLEHFYNSLLLFGMKKSRIPKNWLEAFFLLEQYLQEIDNGQKQLIFLDELPWLDTPKSDFITAFEGFWNNWGCHRPNLMVVVCGSANSWILDKLINNHGGLYNRVTYEIKLNQFSLSECEQLYKYNGVYMSRYDIVGSYMVFGGIPYYLGYLKKGLSLSQNIDELIFNSNGVLRYEFDRLFQSAFSTPEAIKKIIKFLYTKKIGYTRKEIIKGLGIGDGGTLTQYLNSLIVSDFVVKYYPFGVNKKEVYYRLVDPFCLFYLHFVVDKKNTNKFWEENINSQSLIAWKGLAFENVCVFHIEKIKKALGVQGVFSENSIWNKNIDDSMQIDLILNRHDNVVNMCEMKYYSSDFVVNKDYYRIILDRQEKLSKMVSPKCVIHNTLITSFGLKQNEYSGVFSKIITIDDLFN